MAETIQTFTGGMDLDTEKALRSNNVTGIVENFRLVTNTNGSTGALETLKGNSVYTAASYLTRVYAYCHIDNYLVLFGKFSTASVITKILLNEDESIVSETEVYSDEKNNSTGTLDFVEDTIKVVGRYESDGIIKVYWTDGTNPVRYINIAINNTTDGQVYNGSTNYYVAPDKLELVPNALFNAIQSVKVKKGGLLNSGVVRYVYQYYNKYGTETLFSTPTNPIHLVESNDIANTSNKYIGSDVDVNTGKSVELTFTHLDDNNGFDHLKVIRIHYSTFGGTPTVNLVAEIELEKYFTATSKTYTVIDTGNSLYEYLPEEISVLGNILFTATDIATKDDLLFASNINENSFDVTFDARAFRFPTGSSTTYLTNDGVDSSYTLSADTPAGWTTFLAAIGSTNDCINLYNDLTYDDKATYSGAKYNCKFQQGNAIYGGSGVNVKYAFVTKEFVLDNRANSTKSGTNNTVRTLSVDIDTDANNYSFTNYASPYMSQVYRGYQRGEIYRFGIVFYDEKGRPSKAKWIGDVRFPSFQEHVDFSQLATLDSGDGTIESDILGIQFSVRNVPATAVAWSIVRMERTNTDKTIVTQGILSNSFLDDGSDYHFPFFPTLRATGQAYGTSPGSLNDDVLLFMSPDINYGELDYKDGDYFEQIGYYSEYGTYVSQDSTANENVLKYVSFATNVAYNKITPNKVIYNEPAENPSVISIGGLDIHPLVSFETATDSGILGTAALFTYDGTLTVASGSTATNIHNTGVVNVRRINNSQYGGNTYESRFGNTYITCGDIITTDSVCFTRTNTYATAQDVYGGDIFITMYERLHGIFYNGFVKNRIVYAPLESKYNLSINHGFTYSRNVGVDDNVLLVRETAGTHSDEANPTVNNIVQDKDFYLYNTVYSSIASPIVYVSMSNLDSTITSYKARILVSNKKINNELVDSWARFSVNDFIDVDTTYGSVNNLVVLKGKLFFLQDKAFGVLSVNDRAVVVDTTSASGLVVGTGGVLDRYDYLSTYYGNTNKYGALASESGIYWIDNNKSDLILYDGEGVKPLSKIKKIDKFFKGIYNTITDVKVAYCPKYNEVWFKITTDEDLDILIFSELMNCFHAFYTIPATRFITLDSLLLTVYDEGSTDSIYEEDSSTIAGRFFNTQYPAVIEILHSEGYPHTKVYDNLEFNSRASSALGHNIFDTTFDILQVYNDYQNTGEWTLTKGATNNPSTMVWNIDRRERNWFLAIPRNIVNKSVFDEDNIFDSGNLDATQTYKERIRDSYALIRLTYSSEYNFSVPYIKIKHRISQR